MKKLIVVWSLCFIAGCAPSFIVTGEKLTSPIDKIAFEDFTANEPAVAKLFEQAVRIELSSSGFTIVETKEESDAIISGTVFYGKPNWTRTYGMGSWILSVKDKNGQIIKSLTFDTEYHDNPGRISKDLAKRLIQELNVK